MNGVDHETRARWTTAGTTHSLVLLSIEDRSERMRMLATAPLFTLWSWCKDELEQAANEIDRLKARVAQLEDELKGADACKDRCRDC